ncbi:MAG: serine hydrolase domain-containing protein [Gammaproteobacteria bacterium]
MRNIIRSTGFLAVTLLLGACASDGTSGKLPAVTSPDLPDIAAVDHYVEALRHQHKVPGLALAIIDHGEVKTIRTYGSRKLEPPTPLDSDTVMYGASLTKFVFATYVMKLIDRGLLDLDKPVAAYFPKPLPEYEEWSDLAGDPRWQKLTLRNLLDHNSGWANYRFFPPQGGFDPNGKLKFYYDPGQRYGYSGEGYILAQRVIEEGLNRDLSHDMTRLIFAPLGMTRTSMIWKDTFAPNYAAGYNVEGKNLGHNMQDNARAAGSMDTTIRDFANFVAAYMRGDLISRQAQDEMLRPQIAITSAHQFPSLDPATDPRNREVGLAAGIGVVTWRSPYGPAFMKGGHNAKTDNMLVCLETAKRCVILLSNTAKGDRMFPQIIRYVLGDTRFPWRWEYNSQS